VRREDEGVCVLAVVEVVVRDGIIVSVTVVVAFFNGHSIGAWSAL
jgi:hypothetical protein